ncbi:MAG: DUF3999 domain-containing protein [Pseudomonadota bacterium]
MRFWKVVLLLIVSTGPVLAENGIPQKGDFAWGMELELVDASPFYRIPLPLDVYAGIVRSDLGDLRVFNGQGAVVPHDLSPSSEKQAPGAEVVKTKIFPLYAARDSDIESIIIQSPRQWRDEWVSITTRERYTASEEVLHGYLLQLQEEESRPALALHLHWQVESQGFVHRLKVETSNDLQHWRTHSSGAVVADLRYGGERLLKQEIPLGNTHAKYLRLSPAQGSKLIDLQGAGVQFSGETQEPVPNRLTVEQLEPGEQAGEYLFELPGPLVVVNLDILPAEINTLLRATLYSRADLEQRWKRRGSGLIYKLVAEGEPLQQTELPVQRTQDRYWKLVVDTSGGGFGDVPPELAVGWAPHNLRFAARGEAPFTLVYGSGRVGPSSGGALLTGFAEDRQESLTSDQIRFAGQFELAGPAALAKKFEHDWKRWFLWGVLLLGTGLLGWMAWSILRQLSD